LGRDLLKLILWHSNIERTDNICSLGWKPTLQVQTDGSLVITFSLFNLCSLRLLVRLKKPLEVVFLELSHIWVVFLLSDLDALIPSMKLLVHSHGFFDLIMLDEDRLCLVELLVKDSKLGLNSEVVDAFCSYQLVDLSEIVCLGNVSEGGIAPLCNVEVLLFECHLGDGLPVRFGLGSELERFEDLNCFVQSLVLQGSSKLNQSLIKII